ncbi:hypothetical protein [Kitasatospora griseola]|uniref:hypothetical protein n=1 Tax=Kitasatospora griseola TaxID=2064 RepID=UPI000AED2848|nr:hypothetical protein [Kitasatospora griseola]
MSATASPHSRGSSGAASPPRAAQTPLPPGFIQLYDNHLPSLDAGRYQVTVTTEVAGLDTGDYFQPVRRDFEVRVPQFFLDPRDVGEMFPPANSNGAYEGVLPSLVLNHCALPWERLIADEQPKSVPWLALLTLGPHEPVPEPGAGPTGLRTGTVSQFLAAKSGVLGPAIDPATVDATVLASSMQSIVLPGATFQAIVPRLDELRYLAHVRRTDTAGQAACDGEEHGWYAIVWSNRFPDSRRVDGAGTRNLVCLASLEGFAPYLGPGAVLPTKPDGTPVDIQLAVLASWTFVSNPDADESFADLLRALVPQRSGDAADLLLRVPLPPNTPASPAADRLRQGYVPLGLHTSVGDRTFAWYRGPLTPVRARALPPQPPRPAPHSGLSQGADRCVAEDGSTHWTSSSQLTIYLPEQGVFDLSYAAAFETGRALALSDRAFALALLGARRAAYAKLNRIGERLSTGRFDAVPVADLVGPRTHRNLFASRTADLRQTFARLPDTAVTCKTPRPVRQRPNAVTELHALLDRRDVRELLVQQVDDELSPVTDWLADLTLLHNVPFDRLVPDERLLPIESIRFFHIDPSWIEALVDGALSVAVDSSRDAVLHTAWRQPLLGAVRSKAGRVRARRRGRDDLAVATDGGPPPARSGLLIRSAVVAGWPGLVVTADDGHTGVLRMETLSQNVMIVLFDGVPETVTLGEPWHGLRLGVEEGDLIRLRRPDGIPLGQTFSAGRDLSQFWRAPAGQPAERVIALGQLVHALGATPVGPEIGAALLATQLVQAPLRLTFAPPAAPRGESR